ncbi:MAG: VOC family protein [Cyclonatronaceae bacterium]
MQDVSSSGSQPTIRRFVPQHEIRDTFSRAMSDMYKKEVPLYGDLLEIVRDINREHLQEHPDLEEELGSLDRVSEERHGAIRLGKPEELATMARLFSVMGMVPVGYYDLSVANLPVHSTAFRPIDQEELAKNPFRVFTSLLRTDLLDEATRKQAQESLRDRQIFTDGALELIGIHEYQGGLTPDQAEAFIREALETFRWHSEARVSRDQYEAFLKISSLVADIASFKGPHINHLTPRVLNIKKLHQRMQEMGIETIPEVQGPPSGWPILLQQTSFRALVETTLFPDGKGGYVEGRHRARFGEIEQRHTALKPDAMALYDRLIAKAKEQGAELRKQGEDVYRARYPEMLAGLFEAEFPAKTNEQLRRLDLGYFVYELTDKGREDVEALQSARDSWRSENGKGQYRTAQGGNGKTGSDINARDPKAHEILEKLIAQGLVRAVPVTYEDFLPVSAAGIFKSNLDERSGQIESGQSSNRALLEEALGAPVGDYHDLYSEQEDTSIQSILAD